MKSSYLKTSVTHRDTTYTNKHTHTPSTGIIVFSHIITPQILILVPFQHHHNCPHLVWAAAALAKKKNNLIYQTDTHTRTHTHRHTQTDTDRHRHRHTHTDTHTHTDRQTQTDTDTDTDTHTHTHTHRDSTI